MKKILILSLSAFILLGSGIAIGSSINGEYKGKQIVRLLSDGKELKIYDVPAYIDEGGRTMVPIATLRNIGLQVTWNPDTFTVDAKIPNQLTDAELSEISKGVGLVYALDGNGKAISQGSGFLIENGLFITCFHVVSGSTSLQVTLNGRTYNVKDYVFKDEQKDLYGVKLDTSDKGLQWSKEVPLVGTAIWAIGYPSARYQVSKGIALSFYEDHIIHGATTPSGYSGGIIVNDKGTVVGITSNGSKDVGGGAIPTSYLKQELNIQK